MSANVDVSTGLAITFDSGFFAEIVDCNISGGERAAIPTSHMGTAAPGAGVHGNMTFIPGHLSNPGTYDAEIHFNPDTTPPIDSAAEAFTITFDESDGDTSGATWASSGFMVAWGVALPLEDKMTMTCTIQISGGYTITAGS